VDKISVLIKKVPAYGWVIVSVLTVFVLVVFYYKRKNSSAGDYSFTATPGEVIPSAGGGGSGDTQAMLNAVKGAMAESELRTNTIAETFLSGLESMNEMFTQQLEKNQATTLSMINNLTKQDTKMKALISKVGEQTAVKEPVVTVQKSSGGGSRRGTVTKQKDGSYLATSYDGTLYGGTLKTTSGSTEAQKAQAEEFARGGSRNIPGVSYTMSFK